ncbi:MAG: DUF4124 domain-containing protein [Chromatiales bacterium]|jgi:hypothetical protein
MAIILRVAGFLLSAVVCSSTLGAGVYRWVDEQGRTHFGDRPPVSAEAQAVDLPRPAPPSAGPSAQAQDREKARRKLLEYYDDKRAEEKAAAEQARQERDAREAGCRQARRALKRYTSSGRIYKPTADGGRAYLSAEELDALIGHLEQQVSSLCD